VQFTVAGDGTLSSITAKPVDTGSFPGMLTPDPSASFLYVTTATSGELPSTSILGYTIDPLSGALTLINASPFLTGENPVFIAADPSGRFLYVVNAVDGTGSSVTEFTIDATTGVLTGVPGSPVALPSFPLTVAIDPGAQFAYIGFRGEQGRGAIRILSIDQNTGALTETSASPVATQGAILTFATTY
jgi:6-phosphogluconolactonase (cycloisomerase 2 family)